MVSGRAWRTPMTSASPAFYDGLASQVFWTTSWSTPCGQCWSTGTPPVDAAGLFWEAGGHVEAITVSVPALFSTSGCLLSPEPLGDGRQEPVSRASVRQYTATPLLNKPAVSAEHLREAGHHSCGVRCIVRPPALHPNLEPRCDGTLANGIGTCPRSFPFGGRHSKDSGPRLT